MEIIAQVKIQVNWFFPKNMGFFAKIRAARSLCDRP